MRRMLDPKEIGGGGGDEKLYCHCISFSDSSSDKGGRIGLNYYSKKKDKFTYETFKKEFDEKKQVACSGYIQDGNNYFTVFILLLAKVGIFNEIHVRYMDTVHHIYDMCALHSFKFGDNVSEVI